ncbi:MAG: MFS transporter, partial [Methylosarcina sp.]
MAFFSGPLARNRNFRLLFASQVISLTGSGVTTVGLALFAHQLVGGESAAAVIGNALMLRILAFLMFSQPAGILADQIHRKTLLIFADLFRFGLMALFPFIQNVWQVYAMIFLINMATAFFTPIYDSTIPEVAGREHYVKALSL